MNKEKIVGWSKIVISIATGIGMIANGETGAGIACLLGVVSGIGSLVSGHATEAAK